VGKWNNKKKREKRTNRASESAIHEYLCIVLLSVCLDIVDFVVLNLYLVKFLLSLYDVFFFVFLLPVIVNKDEYKIGCTTQTK